MHNNGLLLGSVRILGSAALNMCLVAEGAVEGSVSLGLYPWDKAAGVIIVEEAGGVVIDNEGKLYNILFLSPAI